MSFDDNFSFSLNDDEQDLLRELVNIAYGHATSSISVLLGAYATLHVPKITVLKIDELERYISDLYDGTYSCCYRVIQQFRGKVGGETLFVTDVKSAENLTKHLVGSADKEEYLNDAIMELANILSSATIGKLAESFDFPVVFSAPIVQPMHERVIANPSINPKRHFSYVIIIQTLLEFKNQEIKGELMILLEEGSFEQLHLLLAGKIAELMG
ncbi:MAG: hypothetical protein K6347_02975 [Campylobacterales bacterium]